GVFGHEVRNHVAAEPVFQIEHVVRNAELVRDEPRVGDGIERAARAVRHTVAVAEQLHGGTRDVVPRVHKQRGGDGAVHPARHGDEDAIAHRCRTADSCRTFSTIFGMAPMTASTSSTELSFPKEKRSAATPSANSACSRAASSTALPSATIPGTFSVPGRMPNCWPPPWMIASTTCRSRTMSAPIPFGAPIL